MPVFSDYRRTKYRYIIEYTNISVFLFNFDYERV